MKKLLLLINIITLSFFSTYTIQAQNYVYTDATGANNGTSWADAFTDLQPALDCADAGEEIWVAAGTYLPTEEPDGAPTGVGNERYRSFHIASKDVQIYGGFDGTETLLSERDFTANTTILSGDFNNDDVVTGGGATLNFTNNGENAYHVFVTKGLNAAAVLDGFSIIRGNADGNSQYNYEGDFIIDDNAGGLYNDASSPTLTNLTFTQNNASNDGGGMYNEFNASPTLNNVTFTVNRSTSGGGMFNNAFSLAVLTNVVFSANRAISRGGGMTNVNSSTILTNVTFSANSGTNGGAMQNITSSPSLTNTLFYGNVSNSQKDISNSDGLSVPVLSFSAVEDYDITGCATCITLTADPFINAADPDGADNILMTADDGLALIPGSPPVGVGTATGAPTTDITGATRPNPPSMGAYEEGIPLCIAATRLYVNTNATGLNNGTTWTDAFTDLQPALDCADAGEEIWVAAGTYLPIEEPDGAPTGAGNERYRSFHIASKDVQIYGGFDGTETLLSERDWQANQTILSGDFNNDDVVTGGGATLNFTNNGENAYHVFVMFDLNATAVLDGFSIIRGNADGNSQYNYELATIFDNSAAGLFNDFSSLTLTNLKFSQNNASSRGGGMYNTFNAPPRLNNVTFTMNRSANGGGMYNTSSSLAVLTNVVFSANRAFSGGGMTNNSSSTILTNVTFSANSGTNGAAMQNINSSPSLTNTLFYGNVSNSQKDISNSDGLSVPVLSFSAVEDYDITGCATCITLTADPFINAADPDGADNILMTADDGLALINGTPPEGAGTAAGAPGNDITGVMRPNPPSMGAYEAALSMANIVVAGTGDLEFIDNDDRDDDLTIALNGSNYRFTDPTNPLTAGAGATQVDANTVDVPIASVTGTIEIATQGGDDSVTTDFSGGNFTTIINYDGGAQNSTNPGDILSLQGGGTFASVEHSFINENDGGVAVAGNSAINYIGLEPVIDNLMVTDRVFTFTGANENITLQDEATAGSTSIDSTLGESVTFTNPTNSLTINTEVSGGSGIDAINIQGLDAAFDADLTVNGGTDDNVNFDTNPTAIGTGNFNINGQTIKASQNVSTLGAGSITFNANRNILVDSSAAISAENGDITCNGNASSSITSGVFMGVIFSNASVVTTGTGNILMTGNGFSDTAGTSFTHGVLIANAANVQTLGSGLISLTGIGANGNVVNDGVRIRDAGTVVRSNGGGITLNGTGGINTGNSNLGVSLETGSLVEDVADGDIIITGVGGTGVDRNVGIGVESGSTLRVTNGDLTLTGTGGNGVNANFGIYVTNSSSVEAVNGDISFNGTSGNGTGNNNEGITIVGSAVIDVTGTGSINMMGTSTGGINDNKGIVLFGAGTEIKTNGGGITLTGQGAGTGIRNRGISLEGESLIEDISNGTINLSGTGGNGTDINDGIIVSNSTVQTNGGDINASGIAGDGNGNLNQGVVVNNQSSIEALNLGNIFITGQGGIGEQQNRGVEIQGADVRVTTNGGNISINGTANTNTFGPFNVGSSVRNGAEISTIDNGTISINGTGGGGTNVNRGVEITTLGTTITTADGNVILSGNGGNATGGSNRGITILDQALIETTGSGTITADGLGGNGTLENFGTHVDNATLRTSGGGITVNGTGGVGTGTFNRGVFLANMALLEDTAAGIVSITGQGGTGTDGNSGVFTNNATVQTNGGGTNINGTAGDGTGSFNRGISLEQTTRIEDILNGSINLIGQGGTGVESNNGILVTTSAIVRSNGGGITANGIAGVGTGNNNTGLRTADNAIIEDLSGGDILINGTGAGTGESNNNGILINTAITTTTGDISMTGIASTTSTNGLNAGTRIDVGAIIETQDGTITLNGTGGTGTGNFNAGNLLVFGANIEATGTGNISLIGQGGASGNESNSGNYLQTNVTLAINGGAISIMGTAGSANSYNNGNALRSNTSIIDNGAGTITINGTGGTGVLFNRGNFIFDSQITSNGGDISITGAGGTGLDGSHIGTSFFGTSQLISTTGAGTINISATGGTGGTDNYGTEIVGSTQITAEDGNIQIDGVAQDASEGIRFNEGSITTTGSGNVILNGTTADATLAAINIVADVATINAGGDIIATANTGKINTPEGIPTTTTFTAMTNTFNGVLAPGQSPGLLLVSGDFNLSAGDTFQVEIDNATTPGTDYDQVAVTGTVDISDATLNLIDNLAADVAINTQFILIDNDGADAILGNFNGLPEGAVIPFNGQSFSISYVGDDGNDVVLTVVPATLSIVATTQAAEDATDGVFTITTTNQFNTDVTVNIMITGTATEGTDYATIGTSVVFPANQNAVTIPVDVIADVLIEGDETVIITMTSTDNANASIGVTDNATVTITDDDAATLSIVATTQAAEDATNGLFTVTTSQPFPINTNVTFTVIGTATAGTDYTVLGTSFNFPANTNTATITVPVIADNLVEADETVIVTLTGTDNTDVTIGTPDNATVTITDDDTAELSIVATTQAAEDATDGLFTVTTDNQFDGDVIVNVSITGTATEGTDYGTIGTSVVFPANQNTVTIPVAIIADAIVEGDETVIITITGTDNTDVAAGASDNATVTITDNDAAELSIVATTQAAEDATNGLFTVTTTNQFSNPVLVNVSITGTATEGTDYAPIGVVIAFPANQNTTTIPVTVIADAIAEADETVILTMTGTNNVDVTIGATNEATITIIDDDNAPPIAVCQPVVVSADTNCEGIATAADFDGGSTDPENDPLTFTVDPIGPYPLGVTNVTLTVSDGISSDTCMTTITVEDDTAPVAVCQDITVQLDEFGQATITADQLDGGSTDNCGNLTFSASQTEFTCADIGGGIATLPPLLITGVLDADLTGGTPKALELKVQEDIADLSVYGIGSANNGGGSDGEEFTFPAVAATAGSYIYVTTDNDQFLAFLGFNADYVDGAIAINGDDAVELFFNGTVIDTFGDINVNGDGEAWEYTDGWAYRNDEQNINNGVFDPTNWTYSGPGALDGEATNATAATPFPIGTFTATATISGTVSVILTVTDDAGLSSMCTATVTVEDNIAPTITCPSTVTVSADAGTCSATGVALGTPVTNDNCAVMSVTNDAPATFPLGTTMVTWTVTDNAGTTNSCIQEVIVEDNEMPNAVCQNITVQLDVNGMVTILAADIDNNSSDLCGGVSFSIDQDTFTCANVGENDVILTVTDDAGNESTCVAVVTVEDNIAPTAVCQDLTIFLDEDGQASITVDQINNGSSDACGIQEVSIDITDFDCSNFGDNTVTLTVTDINGNESTCEATVSVMQNNAAPVAMCQNITVVLNQDGMAFISPAIIDAGSMGEGCDNGLVIDVDTFTCDDTGVNEVTLTVTNGNGETASCVALVNVVDNTAPVITCPEDIVIIAATDPFELPDFVVDGTVLVEDNCLTNLTITQDPPVGTFVNAGETEIEITVTDPNGNEVSCEFTILVDPSLGTENNAITLKSLSLYPNPASSFIVLENPNNLALKTARLIDVTGRTVKQFDVSRMTTERVLDISEIASAGYFLIVDGTAGSVTFQVIKR